MVTNLSVSRALAQGKLVVSVDESRPSTDLFKLPTHLRTLVDADIAALETGDSQAHGAEGERIEASGTVRAAFEKIESVLRIAYNGIGAIPGADILPGGITEADRLGVFTTYGWEKAQLGRFTDQRLLVLAELAVQGETTVATPAWRYASTLVSVIQAQLDLIEAEEPAANSGQRQVFVAGRAEKRDLLEKHLARVRHYYCSASDELDATKELARIAFQPRRARGTVNPTPAAASPVPAAP